MNRDERLERISKASLRLVSVLDKEFNLSDKELDLVIKGIWDGIDKALDGRHKEIKNRHIIRQDDEDITEELYDYNTSVDALNCDNVGIRFL